MSEWDQCSRFFWVHVHFDGRYRPSTDFFLVWGHIDGRYRPIFFWYDMNPYRRSISTDFWVKLTVDQISTVFSSKWILIDRRYQPYSQVGESLSTVDIDRDRSTGRLKSNRPIDDTCGNFLHSASSESSRRLPPRVPGLGQITWWIVCWQKMRGHIWKKLYGNREIEIWVNSGGVGEHGQLTRSSNRFSPQTNTNAQRILLESHLLRSAWHPLALICWIFPHSF